MPPRRTTRTSRAPERFSPEEIPVDDYVDSTDVDESEFGEDEDIMSESDRSEDSDSGESLADFIVDSEEEEDGSEEEEVSEDDDVDGSVDDVDDDVDGSVDDGTEEDTDDPDYEP